MQLSYAAGLIPVLMPSKTKGRGQSPARVYLGQDKNSGGGRRAGGLWSSFSGKAEPSVDHGDVRATALREFHEETSGIWTLALDRAEMDRRVLRVLTSTTFTGRTITLFLVDFSGLVDCCLDPFAPNEEKTAVRWFDVSDTCDAYKALHPKFRSDYSRIVQFLSSPW